MLYGRIVRQSIAGDAAAEVREVSRYSSGIDSVASNSFFRMFNNRKIHSKFNGQLPMDQAIPFPGRTKCLWKYFDVEQDPRVIDASSPEITSWIAVSSRRTRTAWTAVLCLILTEARLTTNQSDPLTSVRFYSFLDIPATFHDQPRRWSFRVITIAVDRVIWIIPSIFAEENKVNAKRLRFATELFTSI